MPVNAQKLNALCQKMVSKIEITFHSLSSDSHYEQVIELGYNENDYTNSLTLYNIQRFKNDDTFKTVYKRNGDKLTRDCYFNGKKDRDYSFRYWMDGGKITRYEEWCHASDGSNEVIRQDADLEYAYPYNDVPRLTSITNKTYVRLAGTNEFLKTEGEDSYTITCLRYEDGNVNQTRGNFFHGRGKIDDYRNDYYRFGERENDTNINWDALVVGYNFGSVWRSSYGLPEYFTEWTGIHSFNLLEYVRYQHQELVYDFDSNDNLVKITIYIGKNRKIYREVAISYVPSQNIHQYERR